MLIVSLGPLTKAFDGPRAIADLAIFVDRVCGAGT
jgi:hypothetical protein